MMPSKKDPLVVGEYYHVYNRGNNKQQIFFDEQDYKRFFQLLYLANSVHNFNLKDILTVTKDVFETDTKDKIVTIHAVCVMPNHYHLLVSPLTDTGLSLFMQKLGTGYSMYLNHKRKRTGGLFEGTYKAKHIAEDRYLKYLFSYIHLNPQSIMNNLSTRSSHEEVFSFVASYPYSSLSGYIDSFLRSDLGMDKTVTTTLFQEYFTDRQSVKRELYDWITYSESA